MGSFNKHSFLLSPAHVYRIKSSSPPPWLRSISSTITQTHCVIYTLFLWLLLCHFWTWTKRLKPLPCADVFFMYSLKYDLWLYARDLEKINTAPVSKCKATASSRSAQLTIPGTMCFLYVWSKCGVKCKRHRWLWNALNLALIPLYDLLYISKRPLARRLALSEGFYSYPIKGSALCSHISWTFSKLGLCFPTFPFNLSPPTRFFGSAL